VKVFLVDTYLIYIYIHISVHMRMRMYVCVITVMYVMYVCVCICMYPVHMLIFLLYCMYFLQPKLLVVRYARDTYNTYTYIHIHTKIHTAYIHVCTEIHTNTYISNKGFVNAYVAY
jgi:hypothetical protein